MTAILMITDGTTEVDLLGVDGYILNSWRPAIAGYKGGGTFQSSSLSDGRRLVHKTFDAVVERMDLKALGVSQDILITTTQELRRLLEKASDYWTTEWQDTPVYIVAKASKETNTRYAIIHTGVIPEDENPYSQPFLQAECESVMNNLALIVERGHWGDNVPGTGTCVEVSGTQDWDGITPLVFNGSDQEIDCLSAASLDNLPDNAVAGKGQITVHGWIKTDGYGEGNQGRIAVKGSDDVDTRGWHFYVSSGFGLVARVSCDTSVAISRSGLDEFTADGEWLYVLMTYSETAGPLPADRTIYLNVGGTWVGSYTAQNFSVGNYNQDGGDNLIIGNNDGGTACFDGEIGWLEVAQSVIASPAAGDFTPPPRCIMPAPDANSVFLGIEEGSGTTITDSSGQGNDGTAANDDWGDVCSYTFGRSETCLEEVYIANKHNTAQLTHVFVDNGGVFGVNLIGTALPYDLLPAAPADGDAVYFGIDTSIVNSGPFSNFVFDIGTAATYGAGDSLDWEYYDSGTAWTTLTTQDNTNADGAMTGNTFDTAGVGCVSWLQNEDWIPFAVNGVTAYWVRAVLTVATGVTTPTQQNRDVYTAVWPYVDIASDQVVGDIEALARMLISNQSQGELGPRVLSNADRVVLGTRSLSRGEDFTAYINMSDEQNPSFVTVTLAGVAVYADDPEFITGRRTNLANPPDGFNDFAYITIASSHSEQYIGKFHVYLRGRQTTGAAADPIEIRLSARDSAQSVAVIGESDAFKDTARDWEILDLGVFNLPVGGSQLLPTETGNILLYFQVSGDTAGTADAYVSDIILIPVDEYAGDFRNRPTPIGWRWTWSHNYLDIDSISLPREGIRSVLKLVSDDTARAIYQIITNSNHFFLQANSQQRVWFLLMRTAVSVWHAEIDLLNTVRAYSVAQYLSARGNR